MGCVKRGADCIQDETVGIPGPLPPEAFSAFRGGPRAHLPRPRPRATPSTGAPCRYGRFCTSTAQSEGLDVQNRPQRSSRPIGRDRYGRFVTIGTWSRAVSVQNRPQRIERRPMPLLRALLHGQQRSRVLDRAESPAACFPRCSEYRLRVIYHDRGESERCFRAKSPDACIAGGSDPRLRAISHEKLRLWGTSPCGTARDAPRADQIRDRGRSTATSAVAGHRAVRNRPRRTDRLPPVEPHRRAPSHAEPASPA